MRGVQEAEARAAQALMCARQIGQTVAPTEEQQQKQRRKKRQTRQTTNGTAAEDELDEADDQLSACVVRVCGGCRSCHRGKPGLPTTHACTQSRDPNA